MPVYPYRCEQSHVTETIFPFSQYPTTITCDCGALATRIINYIPQFNIDNVDRAYDLGAGQHFSSRSDRKRYMKENNLTEMGPEDSAKVDRKYKEMLEYKADTGLIPH